jgi:mannose-6-phosphate isomerase-like protein (cupin superfamily)
MIGYTSNIMDETLDNTNFRKVLFTGKHMQLVVMCLKPGEDIGKEVHDHVDQFFRIEQGECKVEIDEKEYILSDDLVVIVPAGSMHNVTNTSDSEDLKLYTIYSPANHPDGTIHSTREEAMIAEEEEHHH